MNINSLLKELMAEVSEKVDRFLKAVLMKYKS